MLVIGLTLPIDITGTPTTVDELPLSVVNLDSIPSMRRVFRRKWCARGQCRKTESFAVATNDDRFETRRCSYGGKETSIPFADGKPTHEGRSRGGRLDAVVEEGFDVVGYVMVEPGEDCAGLVCGRREGCRELSGYPVERGNGSAGKLGSMSVWDGEIAAEEAGGCGSRYLGLRLWVCRMNFRDMGAR